MKITITKSALWVFIGRHDFALWWSPLNFCHYFSLACKCGRRHSYSTDKYAETMGWRKINKKWVCPFCCNNTAYLEMIFGK
jgi:hypothetical protein